MYHKHTRVLKNGVIYENTTTNSELDNNIGKKLDKKIYRAVL